MRENQGFFRLSMMLGVFLVMFSAAPSRAAASQSIPPFQGVIDKVLDDQDLYGLLSLGILGLIFLIWLFFTNRRLQHKVTLRTQQISEINTQLEQQNNLLQAIFQSSPDVLMCFLDTEYRYLNFNHEHRKQMKQVFGVDIKVGMSIVEAFGTSPYAVIAQDNFQRVLAGESLAELQEVGAEEDGNPMYWQMSWSPVQMKNGEVVGISGFVINISEMKRTERLLRNNEYFLHESQRIAHAGSYSLDLTTGHWNGSPELHHIFGIDATYPHTRESWEALILPEWRDRAQEYFQEILRTKKRYDNEYPIVRRENGEVRWVHSLGEFLLNSEGVALGMIGTMLDVTEQKKTNEEILYLSYHDQLTGLYNRRYYVEELTRLDVERNYPLTVVMADVNGLKLMNDSFGHSCGDELLRKVADVMKKACRKDEILARIGGDEFVILLPKTDTQATEQIVKRIQKYAAQERVGSVELSISFGCETKRDGTQTIEEILKKAEDHMYTRKLLESPSMRGKTITTIINTLFDKNKQEEDHALRVSTLALRMGIALDLPAGELDALKNAGLVHDIGKIAINETLFQRRGPLTAGEWEEVKRHPEIGYRLLCTVQDMAELAEDVLEHHERWDGQGYPQGLKGEEISLHGRILAIADAYEAMTSARSYRTALTEEAAVAELTKNAGTQFDPELVTVFLEKVRFGVNEPEERNEWRNETSERHN